MVGVAKSTLPTRTVGEVLAMPGRKSMPGSGLVRPEYFANPSVPLAKYSLHAWSGERPPTTRPSQAQARFWERVPENLAQQPVSRLAMHRHLFPGCPVQQFVHLLIGCL
jgi:hypothetical protein